MNTVYRLKKGIDLNELAKIGFEIVPDKNGGYILFKVCEQELGSYLPQFLLQRYYNNPIWYDQIYKKSKKEIRRTIHLKYNKERKIVPDNKFTLMLKQWRIQIDSNEDNWIAMKSADPFDNHFYYSKVLLDKYFDDTIKELKEKELIEEIEAQ